MSIYHWVALGIIVFIVYKAVSGIFGGRGKVGATGSAICPACGTRANPAVHTKGSTWIELILWLCFIIPGVIYSVWRLTSREKVCPACKAPGMVPVTTPRGQQLAKQFAAN